MNHIDDSCPEGPFAPTGIVTRRCDECGKLLIEHRTLQADPNGLVFLCDTTPRVARSVDDLRAGMWVAVQRPIDDGWETWHYDFAPGDDSEWDFNARPVVILADPPAPPVRDWLVPADTMAELRAKLELKWGAFLRAECIEEAARALLDAATEVER